VAIKSPKQKGSAGELEVCRLLTDWASEVGIGLTLERNLEQVRHGGADVNGVPGMEVEVKRVESNGINQWWAQVCRAAARTGKLPFLAHRRNRQPWRFRVSTHVAMEHRGSWSHFPIVADLELDQAKRWFQEYIKLREDELDELPSPGACAPPPPPPVKP
jgi:hypothetical protein